MKSLFTFLAVASLVCVVGCGGSNEEASSVDVTGTSITLCGDCGEILRSEACCSEEAKRCECGLHKGSPGCCKITLGEDVTLCGSCGEEQGSDACCAEGLETCQECGMHKGSIGCCLMPADESKSSEEPASSEEAA